MKNLFSVAKTKPFCALFLVLAWFVLASEALAGGGDSIRPANQESQPVTEWQAQSDSAHQLEQLLLPINGYAARFEQTVHGPDGYQLQQSSGSMSVARPGKIRWISEPPLEQWVVADGETLWIYDPDLEQVTIRAFQQDLANTPAILLVGELSELTSYYRVSVETKADIELFSLEPVDAANFYRKIIMGFAGKTPISMDIWDSMGQQTAIKFSEARLNPTLDQSQFTFVPPAGVDILVSEGE